MDLSRHTDENALFQLRRRNKIKLLDNLTKSSKKRVDCDFNQEGVLSNDDNSAIEIYKTYRRNYNLPYCQRLANASLRIHNKNALRYGRMDTKGRLPFIDELVPDVKGDNVFTTGDSNYGNLSSTWWEIGDSHLESIPASMDRDIDMFSPSFDAEFLHQHPGLQDNKNIEYFQDDVNKIEEIVGDDLVLQSELANKYKRSVEYNPELISDVQPSSKNNPKLECHNCHTKTTPIWRKGHHGSLLCNACGLFGSIHGGLRKSQTQKNPEKLSGNHTTLWPNKPYKRNRGSLEMFELPTDPSPPFLSQSTDSFRDSTTITKDKGNVNTNHFDFTSRGDAIDELLNANLFHPDSFNA